MNKRIIVAGAGFAGMWAAISAARLVHLNHADDRVEIFLVSPEPKLTIRPRLYEAVLESMDPSILEVLKAANVNYIRGRVINIDVENKTITVSKPEGEATVNFDSFVLAAGSQVFHPELEGLKEYSFDVNSLEKARELDSHLQALAKEPDSAARNTVVVAGGGLTGLETVTEMPERLNALFGAQHKVQVIIVDNAARIGQAMGEHACEIINQALTSSGIAVRTGVRVSAINAGGVTLSNGEFIPSKTVIWTAGMRASPLTRFIPGEKDPSGRVMGDACLRAPGASGIFVTGDTVKVPTDNAGNYNVMSCQHAMSLGRVAGHNAAAELLGLPLHPYSQPKYVTCLDLGKWGAVYTEGWDHQVMYQGAEAKKIKQEINTQWIYPPEPDREKMFSVANPDYIIVP
ncbi:FAD-dependent oxidoreductase [Leclercia adecarboxylata]|uniref:NAD(P)/FAD-dependent oxidoreductase n=1 Tax=Leclercia adecarboxylata TaxID=83655 RepID=UPI002DB73087|nr:FAD-dependent oxidoreductase [Leclercia adecarboxylata]MEB6377681.1 FAD-dependent oxidoreductase [Leclercia adecarboxylata]